jgi:hypothetical protein
MEREHIMDLAPVEFLGSSHKPYDFNLLAISKLTDSQLPGA